MRRRLPLATAMLFNAALLLSPLVPRGLVAPFAPRGALAGLVCGAALACFLARLLDRRAAAYGVAALTTMPLFFVVVLLRAYCGGVMLMLTLAFAPLDCLSISRLPNRSSLNTAGRGKKEKW